MNENECLFDLQGYIAVPNALDKEQPKTNALLDKHIEQECASDRPTHRFGGY